MVISSRERENNENMEIKRGQQLSREKLNCDERNVGQKENFPFPLMSTLNPNASGLFVSDCNQRGGF